LTLTAHSVFRVRMIFPMWKQDRLPQLFPLLHTDFLGLLVFVTGFGLSF
jgi:hypothetical protein